MLNFDFAGRLYREFRISLDSIEEAVLAIAERVQRKAQLGRLHWNAASLTQQIGTINRDLGRTLVNHVEGSAQLRRRMMLAPATVPTTPTDSSTDPDDNLQQASTRIQQLKSQLIALESRIQTVRQDLLRDDVQRVGRDLETRGWTLQYVTVKESASGTLMTLADLTATTDAQVPFVVSGDRVLKPSALQHVRPGDVLLLIGPKDDVVRCAALVQENAANTSAYEPSDGPSQWGAFGSRQRTEPDL
ncbi:MAG: hypothetical protein U0172_02330 [Nitrospiraceae bacterium]